MAKDKQSRGLANPVLLKPFEKDEIVVIIETPKGSRNKYAYERVVAIESANHSYAHVQHIEDLGRQFEQELELARR